MQAQPQTPPRWIPAEDNVATNLYIGGVAAREVADTINKLFGNGRSHKALHRRMHQLHVTWGSATHSGVTQARKYSANGISGAEAAHAHKRPQPWHPALDAKPGWLLDTKLDWL